VSRVWPALIVFVSFWIGWAAPARAGLSAAEQERLAAGKVVTRNVDVDLAAGSYFGGIAYVVVRAPADEVMAVLLDSTAYRHILPVLLDAEEVGPRGDGRLVRFRHGSKRFSAEYTALVRRESASVVRFWLDPAFPHDVADCWGQFRVEPLGPQRSLLVYSALVRLDFGPIKLLFSDKIREFALRTPDLVRHYVERRRADAL
jgi:hypothetical protein